MAAHRDFADWYRAASVAPEPELLEQRWAAVEEIAPTLSAAPIVALLRLFAIRNPGEPQAPDFLEAALRKHDPAYSSRGNSEELRVLAGAVLRQCIETGASNAVAAALGLLSASFGTRAGRLPTAQHLSAAETYLAQCAVSVRESKAPGAIRAASLTRERYDELVPNDAFQKVPMFTAITEAATRAASGQSQLQAGLASVWRATQVLREELNFLWWLQARFSRDLKKPFEEFSGPEASYVFAMEISDLTVFIPAPDAILGLIVSSLALTKREAPECKLIDAVNAPAKAWRERRNPAAEIQNFADLCPLLLAMARSLDTDGVAEWVPVYKKQCDVQLDQEMPLSDIAAQVYRERLFTRAMSEIKQ